MEVLGRLIELPVVHHRRAAILRKAAHMFFGYKIPLISNSRPSDLKSINGRASLVAGASGKLGALFLFAQFCFIFFDTALSSNG